MVDAALMFDTSSGGQSFAGQIVGTVLSEKSIDLWGGARQYSVLSALQGLSNSPPVDPGASDPIDVVIQVTTAFVGATATFFPELVMADDEALTSNLVSLTQAPGGSVTVGIPVATLVPKYLFRLRCLPPGLTKRYLGIRYNVLTATITTGKVTARIANAPSTAPQTYL